MTELDTLTHQVTTLFIAAAPAGWVSGEMRSWQVGKTGEFEALATMADQSVVRFLLPTAGVRAWHRLRKVMATPGAGAWLSATCRLTAAGEAVFVYDWDTEPVWSTPTSVGHYLEEAELHPRDAEHTPPWLVERLAEAHVWDAAGS